ncbi:serine/threonine-protein kinase [Mycolicibacterium neworleansense]|uniref:non-specific serine/threonine protein kinase n=1 Tax=Mycolicibacterium neworleansense TaxID=146018 RepID=A0A0H5RUI1_9MYCO|nr:serine/threonine-protein kinase [Mycolicibacterium neworleansense]CRZ17588.1 serine/threonine protein kinase [Mycolicibacterium neworleansense]
MQITAIAGYRVIRQLGAGGMGQVFLVQHPRLPRQDALKLLDAGVSRNDDFKVRFQREADLLAQLSHPNIVTLHDRGEFEGRLWITMEYIDGTDASELVKADGPLDPDLAVQLVGAAAAALDYAWRKQRVTHRDVKPANILAGIDETDSGPQIESVKLADFGIAKAAGESTSLTSTGMTIGTMQYISPEAIEGEEVDNRSDIYSLGCTAFHLLTGQPPFTGTSIAATMSAHLTKPVPSVSTVNPRLPEGMDAVFERVLAKSPDDRYQSCAEFVTALQEATGGEVHYPASAQTLAAATLANSGAGDPDAPTKLRKGEAKPAGPSKPRTVPIAAAVVVTVAVAATAVGIYVTRGGSDEAAAPAVSTAETSTTATVTPPAAGQAAPLPDNPSPNAGCPGTATAHHDLEHPYLGRMRVFVIPQTPSYGAAVGNGACISAVTAAGSVLMPIPVKFGYRFELAEPATDLTGNLFIRYHGGGAHDPAMVLVLVPTAQGFRTIGEDMLDTELIGPGVDGRYVLREHQNDCTPSCADGTWTDKDLHWDGSGYVGEDKPATPAVTSTRTVVTTTTGAPLLYEGKPCTPAESGDVSPDGTLYCSMETGSWRDKTHQSRPAVQVGSACSEPGARARVVQTDGIATCKADLNGDLVWGW